MITDKNDHPVACLTITTALRDEMMSTIQMRIIHNLEAIKEFLKIQGYEDVCAGLYTYAIEEYRKILFLKSFSVSAANEITFPYKRDSGKGFLNHHEKFPRALADKQLPDSCKMLREGISMPTTMSQTTILRKLLQILMREWPYFSRF